MHLYRLSLLAFLLASCGGEAPPIEFAKPAPSAEPEPVRPEPSRTESEPFLSRFQPSQGLVGTKVQILGEFAEDRSRTIVTVGGAPALVLDDEYVLTIEVPIDAQSGPLCVTEGAHTVCGEDFRVLSGPELYFISPERVLAGTGDTTIDLFGDGFTEGMDAWIARESLEILFHTAQRVSVIVPAYYVQGAGPFQLGLSKNVPPAMGFAGFGTFVVENPGPAIGGLQPSTVPVGAVAEVRIRGQGFVASSIVRVGPELELTTELTTDRDLIVRVPESLLPGDHALQVQNPAPGGGTSAPVVLRVQ